MDYDKPVVKFRGCKHWQGQEAAVASWPSWSRRKTLGGFLMSNDQAPYARILCNLSPAGVRDAVRKGKWTGETATHFLRPNSELWERFFELEPELEYETEEDGDDVAAGAVLVIGRPIEIIVENSDQAIVEISAFDFVQTWRKPCKEIRLGDPSVARKFDTYLSESELLEEETKLRTLALTESDESFRMLIGYWRRWISEFGVKYVEETIATGEKIKVKFVPYLQRQELSNALDSLKSAFDEFQNAPNDDSHRAALMDCFSSTCVTIGEIAMVAAKGESKAKEIAEAESWIAEYGSSRMRKAVELGLLQKSMGAYRDERLNLEPPGWAWIERGDNLKDVVNPIEADLDALATARQIDTSSQLRFHSGDRMIWITGHFLNRQVAVRASSVAGTTKYAFDEEPF